MHRMVVKDNITIITLGPKCRNYVNENHHACTLIASSLLLQQSNKAGNQVKGCLLVLVLDHHQIVDTMVAMGDQVQEGRVRHQEEGIEMIEIREIEKGTGTGIHTTEAGIKKEKETGDATLSLLWARVMQPWIRSIV